MIEQLVDEDQVHIVMMRAHVSIGIAADITAAEQGGAQFLLRPGEVEGGIHYYRCLFRFFNLRQGIAFKMLSCAVMPAQYIGGISSPPAIEPHTPGHSAMQIRRRFPDGIGSNSERAIQGIDPWIGSIQCNTAGQLCTCGFRFYEYFFQFLIAKGSWKAPGLNKKIIHRIFKEHGGPK